MYCMYFVKPDIFLKPLWSGCWGSIWWRSPTQKNRRSGFLGIFFELLDESRRFLRSHLDTHSVYTWNPQGHLFLVEQDISFRRIELQKSWKIRNRLENSTDFSENLSIYTPRKCECALFGGCFHPPKKGDTNLHLYITRAHLWNISHHLSQEEGRTGPTVRQNIILQMGRRNLFIHHFHMSLAILFGFPQCDGLNDNLSHWAGCVAAFCSFWGHWLFFGFGFVDSEGPQILLWQGFKLDIWDIYSSHRISIQQPKPTDMVVVSLFHKTNQVYQQDTQY